MVSKKGKSLCIFSAKGGVGKTITTINLAGIISSMGKKVLILDMDLASGGIAVCLNKEPKKNIFNLWEDLRENRYREFSNYVTKYNDSIYFIASPKDPRQAIKMSSKYIDLIIERALFIYDVVLIDTTHYLNEVNLVTLDKVDYILFVTTNNTMDLKNLKSILSIFRDLNIDNYKVLLNNSINPYNEYFGLYDIRNVLKTNIDYMLSSKFFIKNIDSYIMDGKILTLENKINLSFSKDISVLMTLATDFMSQKEVKSNEEE